MIYDEFNCAEVATQPAGAILHEVSGRNTAVRLLFGLLPLAFGGLVLAVFLNGSFHFKATPGVDAPVWQALLAWLILGLIFAMLVVVPLSWAAELLGQRYEYVFDQSQRQLVARSRWFGVVLRSRRYGFDAFDRVCVRRESVRGVFSGGRWGFIVSCEGQTTSERLACCWKPQRAEQLAEAIAAQMALPIQDRCGEAD